MMLVGGEGMEYSVSKLANLSGVSARTLRYYDEIGLLKAKRISTNGYRVYGQYEVDVLQQIMFYRELDLSLEQIKEIIYSEAFDIESALESHLLQLTFQKQRLEDLIITVQASISSTKGDKKMTDQDKFTAFKKDLIQKNEAEFCDELRQKYGELTVAASNAKMAHMSQEQWEKFESVGKELNEKLGMATREGDIASELAQVVCRLHQEWLTLAWPKGHYDPQKHYNLSLMYVHDDRFRAYYDAIEPGAAEFLHDALKIYTGIS